MTTDFAPDRENPLRRVQNAALDRALTDASVAARHLAFAGALETVRRPADRPETASDGTTAADALFASLLVHYGVDRSLAGVSMDGHRSGSSAEPRRRAAPPTPSNAPSPDGSPAVDDRREADPRAVGAALAHVRSDVDLDRAATLATVTTEAVERALETVEPADG